MQRSDEPPRWENGNESRNRPGASALGPFFWVEEGPPGTETYAQARARLPSIRILPFFTRRGALASTVKGGTKLRKRSVMRIGGRGTSVGRGAPGDSPERLVDRSGDLPAFGFSSLEGFRCTRVQRERCRGGGGLERVAGGGEVCAAALRFVVRFAVQVIDV